MIDGAINHGLILLFYRPALASIFAGITVPLSIGGGLVLKNTTYKVAVLILASGLGKSYFVQQLFIEPAYLSYYGFAIGFALTLIPSYCAIVYIASKKFKWPLDL